MTVPRHFARPGRGMLLLRGERDAVATWARRGLVPVHVVPLDGWTAVLGAGPSKALPPYDDSLKVLAGRAAASRLRPAIGLFVVDGNAVVTVQAPGWRTIQRWLVWSPGQGVVRPRHLAAGRPADLTAAAGVHGEAARRGVLDVLVDGRGDAQGVLAELMTILSLPGSDLLAGARDPSEGATRVEPSQRQVARFERAIHDQALHRAELEEAR
ncbi:MAG: hypothetical protein ABI662_01630 [Dermatophilaceae bacterium]